MGQKFCLSVPPPADPYHEVIKKLEVLLILNPAAESLKSTLGVLKSPRRSRTSIKNNENIKGFPKIIFLAYLFRTRLCISMRGTVRSFIYYLLKFFLSNTSTHNIRTNIGLLGLGYFSRNILYEQTDNEY